MADDELPENLAQMDLFDTIASTSLLTHDSQGRPWTSPVELSGDQPYIPAPIPPDDDARIATLQEMGIDRSPNTVIEDLTRLAADLCGCEYSTLSLVEKDRLWYWSTVGLDLEESPRSSSFCAWSINPSRDLRNEVLRVDDARRDRRFAGNPAVVGEPFLRSYMGAPLVARNNQKIGVLCAFTSKQVEITQARIDGLQRLAQLIMREIESQAAIHTSSSSLREELQLQQLSHELRTPLHSIIGHAQLLLDSQLDAEQRSLTGNVLKSAEVLTRVVTSMLETRLSPIELTMNVLRSARHWEEFCKMEATDELSAADSRVSQALPDLNFDPDASDGQSVRVPSRYFGAQGPTEFALVAPTQRSLLEIGVSRGLISNQVDMQISIVQQSWRDLGDMASLSAERFFAILFGLDRSLESLFPRDTHAYAAEFLSSLSQVIEDLRHFSRLVPKLRMFVVRSAVLGFGRKQVSLIQQSLLSALQLVLKEGWTQEISDAWTTVTHLVSEALNEMLTKAGDQLTLQDTAPNSASASCSVELELADVEVVQASWLTISPLALEIAKSFFDALFDADPPLRHLFPVALETHSTKLMQLVSTVVQSLASVQRLRSKLRRLGRLHSRVGVSPPMYDTFCDAFILTLENRRFENWNSRTTIAWKRVLKLLSRMMLEGSAEAAGALGSPEMDISTAGMNSATGAYIESASLRTQPRDEVSEISDGETETQRATLGFSILKVLSVDDNAMNRLLLARMVLRLGVVDCTDAANGLDCLNKLEADNSWDCVFLDLQMPVMGGTVACLRIRERMGEDRPFLVAITADAAPGVLERCREAGFDLVLRKPCSMRTISETLEQALTWRQHRRQ